jgi:hypothetical protein
LSHKIASTLLMLVLLAACALPGAGTPTPTTVPPTATPTTSPTPTVKPLTILVMPADLPRTDSDRYQTLVHDLAYADGMRFQVRNTLSPSDPDLQGDALKVVVALPPDPGLEALAAAAPAVQFLGINISGLPTAPNLSTIGAAGIPVDQQAFLAGYIAGMVAPEWKVGILYPKDAVSGEAARDAFTNGFVFYCGYCRNPNFPQPAGIYPVLVGIPESAPERDYNGYADLLFHNIVKVAYVCPEVATPNLLSYMAQKGMLLIGQTLTSADVRSNWIASIQPDLTSALQNIFPELAAGQGGIDAPTPLFLADVNPDMLSEAKMRLVQDVLTGLQDGTIGTGVTP